MELKSSAAKRNSALVYGTYSGATGVESLSRCGGVHSSAVKLRAEGVRFAAEAVSAAKCSCEGPRFAAEAFSAVRKSKSCPSRLP